MYYLRGWFFPPHFPNFRSDWVNTLLRDAAIDVYNFVAVVGNMYMKKTYDILRLRSVNQNKPDLVLNIYNDVLSKLDIMETTLLVECGSCCKAFDVNGIIIEVIEQMKRRNRSLNLFASNIMHYPH